jgi:hypothetical protein
VVAVTILLRDTARKRLNRLAKQRREGFKFVRGLYPELDWKEPEYTDEQAVTLSGPDAPLIRQAFEDFGLDPRNPYHWRELMGYFAQAHYGKPHQSTGRWPKWNSGHLYLLGMLSLRLKEAHPRWSQEQICKHITTDEKTTARFPEFKGTKVATLRRLLPKAREAYLARRRTET